MEQKKTTITSSYFTVAGLFTLSLRLVVGWTYFSAFWRRVVLAQKLDPEVAGYIGVKFNHFLPNSIWIKSIIQFLVENGDWLWWAMVIFTAIEAIVGLFYMLGFFTRIMSIGVFSLAFGILLGSGWLGTTCLDEWQIGILGVASAFTIFWTGGGKYSIDQIFIRKKYSFVQTKWFRWLGSGEIPMKQSVMPKIIFPISIAIFALCLYTNQVFHGGVCGKLHNKSVKPIVELSNGQFVNDKINFDTYRVEGVDVYGSFLIGISLIDSQEQTVFALDNKQLSQLPKAQIDNHYIAKVAPGKHSLIIPLGAKATITLQDSILHTLPQGKYTLKLTDISGVEWHTELFK